MDEVRLLALRDVRLAYWVVKSQRPGLWNIKKTFPTGVTGATVQGTLVSSAIGCDVFVRDLEFCIRRPNYALGSLWKPVNDTNTTLSPFVDVRIRIVGCPKWEYTDGDTPLEIACTASTKAHDRSLNWYLPYMNSIEVDFTLKRDLLPTESPFEIDLTVKGKYLDCKNFGGPGGPCSEDWCAGELRRFGILPQIVVP
jgi:hypothetical protein